jgi:hypothetical protein
MQNKYMLQSKYSLLISYTGEYLLKNICFEANICKTSSIHSSKYLLASICNIGIASKCIDKNKS